MKNQRSLLFLLIPGLLVIAVLFIYPLFDALKASLTTDQGIGLSRYAELWNDPRERETIFITLRLSVPLSLFSVFIATLVAYQSRKGLRYKSFFNLFLILPMILGTVMISLCLINYLGPTGWSNHILQTLGLVAKDNPLRMIYNIPGVLIGLFLLHFPLTYILIQGHMAGIEPQLDSAARLMGAGSPRIFWSIILPLSWPAICTALALHVVAAFSVFPTAVLLGQPSGQTRVMTIAAYEAAYDFMNYPKGTTIALTMAGIQILLTVLIFGIQRLQKNVVPAGKG